MPLGQGKLIRGPRPQIWHDNEGFLKLTCVYKKAGLRMVTFTPINGDLKPIETAWAALRRQLAEREQQDMDQDKYLTAAQHRARAAQIRHAFSKPKAGETYNYLGKLVRGMPKRLALCKRNRYGKCGK